MARDRSVGLCVVSGRPWPQHSGPSLATQMRLSREKIVVSDVSRSEITADSSLRHGDALDLEQSHPLMQWPDAIFNMDQ